MISGINCQVKEAGPNQCQSLHNQWRGENWISTYGRRLDPRLAPHAKMNSKWIRGLYLRTQNVKPLEGIREKLHDAGLANAFWDTTPKQEEDKKNE